MWKHIQFWQNKTFTLKATLIVTCTVTGHSGLIYITWKYKKIQCVQATQNNLQKGIFQNCGSTYIQFWQTKTFTLKATLIVTHNWPFWLNIYVKVQQFSVFKQLKTTCKRAFFKIVEAHIYNIGKQNIHS